MKFPMVLAGIVALFHDVVVTFGAVSLFNLEFSLYILAVILTIIGFSINDTIVIFDRVRENVKKMRKEQPLHDLQRQHQRDTGKDHPDDRDRDDGGSDPLFLRGRGHP